MDPVVAALLGAAGGALGVAVLIVLVRALGWSVGNWLRVRIMSGDPSPTGFRDQLRDRPGARARSTPASRPGPDRWQP